MNSIIRTATMAGLVAAATLGAPQGSSAQPRRPSASTMQSRTAASTGTMVVNINTASVEQLSALPGVGESKARAIVESRQRRRFGRVEEILRVRGIGRATFRRLRPMLRVEGPTTLGSP
jgi:competence protein ComEA